MLSYETLLLALKNDKKYKTSIKNNYFVTMPNNFKDLHITVYKDQWDSYETVTSLPYHMFHISSNSNDNRCSSYFWVNKHTLHIQPVSDKHFKYNQDTYDFYNSTRSPCSTKVTDPYIKNFQNKLYNIKN